LILFSCLISLAEFCVAGFSARLVHQSSPQVSVATAREALQSSPVPCKSRSFMRGSECPTHEPNSQPDFFLRSYCQISIRSTESRLCPASVLVRFCPQFLSSGLAAKTLCSTAWFMWLCCRRFGFPLRWCQECVPVLESASVFSVVMFVCSRVVRVM
jgi:hypothetical protein